jgi:replicative DNA helicase
MNGPANIPELPANIEAEQALLGAILVNNEAWNHAREITPDNFFEAAHAKFFEIMGKLIQANKVATPITMRQFIPAEQQFAGGLTVGEYLARLATEATSIIHVPDYAKVIKDLSDRRELIALSYDLSAAAYTSAMDVPTKDLIIEAEERLLALASIDGAQRGFRSFDDLMAESIDMTAAAYQRDGRLSGLATGLRDLDSKMGGLQASDLVVVAGRPGMGKSALAGNIALNAAEDGKRVGMFSLEMSGEQNATRILSDRARIPSSAMRRGGITEIDFEKIGDVAKTLKGLPLTIDDTGGLSINQVVTRARRLKKRKGLDLLIVDYIQLMHGTGRTQNRVAEVTEITTGLKALAKELNVPIVALSQLSREVEKRDDKRPQLSDLRESGSIEQDADVVLFLYREEYYLANKEPKPNTDDHAEWQVSMDAAHGKAEIIVGKQRHGPTGPVEVSFEAQFTRFNDLAHDRQLPARF